jgi:mannose-6-phosphate isomerase-like protein (cupin superfamily)
MSAHVTAADALSALDAAGTTFRELYAHGTLSVEAYRPVGTDVQVPHDRDEVYVVMAGTGTFFNGDARHGFEPGDLLFVPAGIAHRFEDFSDDFSTWVLFYGPQGGEQA